MNRSILFITIFIFAHASSIFSSASEQTNRQSRADLMRSLNAHKTIKFEDQEDVADFASQIEDSGFTFKVLEPRIVRYMAKGDVLFTALDHAITRERFHQWHEDIVARTTIKSGRYVRTVEQMNLSTTEKERLINVYATCIASFTNNYDRKFIEPEVCDASDDYLEPRHIKYPVSAREHSQDLKTDQLFAYRSMINEAQMVVEEHELGTFQRIAMAKCISEQSLRFFKPSQHVLKAWHKHRLLSSRAPERSFFMNTGVCSNFSGIAYNAAIALGLKDKVHLAKKGVHVYLEFEEDGQWFHTHPFNSKSKCDITRFSKGDASSRSSFFDSSSSSEW